ncbi:MAG: MFS transporter [Planctomycetes bacterium]|nr:MFS transporter [Planctomycetota bacterium]
MPVIIDNPPAADGSKTPSPTTATDASRISRAAAAHEGRNFFVLALYQVVMRTGWIFKTESVVMPAVLDTITGGGPMGGLLRGCLPVLNRFGHSIPPILFSRRLKVLPQKRMAMLVSTLAMASVFLLLSGLWWGVGTSVPWWMPGLFLVLYLMFFVVTGINNLAFGTLQGKLIGVTRRGRQMLVANVTGSVAAIGAVMIFLPGWLTPVGGRFEMIFGFTAICFYLAAGLVLLLAEPKDTYSEAGRGVRHLFAASWEIVRTDRNFRRLGWVAMSFGTSLVLFPHYQALGRSERLGLSFDNILKWLIIQNVGTMLFSLLAGPVADRRGNRLVMQGVMAGMAAMPLAALALSFLPTWGATLYPAVFLLIGLTPVGFKTFNNYALEISPTEDHPRYLSTLGLCFALPLLLSPVLGWVVEAVGFESVFIGVSAVLAAGWLLTLRLHEPRHVILDDAPAPVVPEDD